MIKISEAIMDIVNENPILQFGFYYQIFNLSKLSEFIKPQLQARTKKQIKTAAITMNLSRLQKRLKKILPKISDYKIENVTAYSNLCVVTYVKTREVHASINKFYERMQKVKGYITINEGVNEITIIFENKFYSSLTELISEKPKFKKDNIAGIGMKFSEEYMDVPGLLHFLIQHFMVQNINIIEIASTYTELFCYIDQADTKLAFNTLFNRFLT